MDQIIIKKITPNNTYPLRLAVLKTCDEYEYKYQGDFDLDTIHFGAFLNTKLVGIVSVMKIADKLFKGNQFQLRGMAVDTNFQGHTIGKKLVINVLHYCKIKQGTLLWCNARKNAVNFYLKQGFKIKGDVFHIQNVGLHYKMFIEM